MGGRPRPRRPPSQRCRGQVRVAARERAAQGDPSRRENSDGGVVSLPLP